MPHPKAGAFLIGAGVQRRKTVTAAEIGEVPPPPVIPEVEQDIGGPVRPPTFPPLDVSAFTGEDILARLREEGFFAPVPGQRGGAPQTFEGQQFVLDFLAQFGVKPTGQRVAQEGFVRTGTFDPFSTMGRLGFQNLDQYLRSQQTGETFGPLKGAEVPLEGGIVITDAEGNPTDRFFNLDRPEVRQAIEDGRFIQPIFGELAQTLQGGLPGGEDFYNVPIEQPRIQLGRALSEFGTPQMYLKSLSDFLDEKVFRDRGKRDAAFNEIDTIREEFANFSQQIERDQELIDERAIDLDPALRRAGGESRLTAQQQIDQAFAEAQTRIDALRDQIENEFFTDQRARREYAKARDIIEFDNPPLEELPFFKEVEPSLLGQATAEQKRVLDERFAGIQQPPISAPPQAGEEAVQQDFLTYVGRLNLAPEFQRWLLDNFGRLGGLWRQSGEPEFIPWLNKFLSGG